MHTYTITLLIIIQYQETMVSNQITTFYILLFKTAIPVHSLSLILLILDMYGSNVQPGHIAGYSRGIENML